MRSVFHFKFSCPRNSRPFTLSSRELLLEFFLCVSYRKAVILSLWTRLSVEFLHLAIATRLCSRRMHPVLLAMIFALFFVHVVNSFLLPLIKACLRAMSRFNCDARSSDFFNCEFKAALPSVAPFNKCFV